MSNANMTNTQISNDANATPRDRAIAIARLRRGIGYTAEGACEAALRAEPTVKLSRDQLKALAFGATLYGFGERI